MKTLAGAASAAAFLSALPAAGSARAEEAEHHHEIVVTAQHAEHRIDLPPATKVTVTADDAARTVNAMSPEDMLKHVPSLIIRKRHVGDLQAPIATRTSGLGSSARSLVYADGVLLSALIGNNNGTASPRWDLVAPEEVARIDVLYGPFSAAYPGNSIGTTVNITTRMPQAFEASARATMSVQDFSLYGTHLTLPSRQYSALVGDRVGPLTVSAAFTRTDAQSQPVSLVTVSGGSVGIADTNRLGAPIRVLGFSGLEHHVQDTAKLKAALDLPGGARVSYLLGVSTDDTRSGLRSFLSGAGGAVYTSGFNAGLYARDALHVAQAVTLEGTGTRFDWHVVGTSYHYAHDLQDGPTASLPGALNGGAGTIQRLDGTGWVTLDAKAAWRPRGDDRNVLSFGAHGDRTRLNQNTYLASNWLDAGTQQGLDSASRGRTRTLALWAQDAVKLAERLTLTLGARQDWWRAWGGINIASGKTPLLQPERRFAGLSPKAALEWRASGQLTARLSLGQAWRFPTVGELYQQVTVGTQLANPNPDLRPERARSGELSLEWREGRGMARASLFDEVVDGALISQIGTIGAATSTFVQNVPRTRARGVELAAERRDLLPGWDLSGSATWADAVVSRNPALPVSVGKTLPGVPRWKADAVLTWRASDQLSLTAAARYASRIYATLDHSDVNGFTWQGFGNYFVVDLRALFRVNRHFDFAIGVDNLLNDKYYLYHPFPQRTASAELRWRY